MNFIVYHRVDSDGFCSCEIIRRWCEERKESYVLVPFNYGDKLDSYIERAKQIDDTKLWIVDVSVNEEILKFILAIGAYSTVWIDHHDTSLVYEMGNIDFFTNKIHNHVFSKEHAACGLVWEYLYPDTEIPKFIQLISDYDNWNNKDKNYWRGNVLPFQWGFRLYDMNPINEGSRTIWCDLFNNDMYYNDVMKNGIIVLQYQEQQNKILMSSGAFEVNKFMDKYNAIACNINGGSNSLMFESVYDESKHDLMISFGLKKNKWVFSFYSTKSDVDCSEIAKYYGGGGHSGAAGCIFEFDKGVNVISNMKRYVWGINHE